MSLDPGGETDRRESWIHWIKKLVQRRYRRDWPIRKCSVLSVRHQVWSRSSVMSFLSYFLFRSTFVISSQMVRDGEAKEELINGSAEEGDF